jgi:hypothetical protein
VDALDLLGDLPNDLEVDAIVLGPAQRLAAELEQDPLPPSATVPPSQL